MLVLFFTATIVLSVVKKSQPFKWLYKGNVLPLGGFAEPVHTKKTKLPQKNTLLRSFYVQFLTRKEILPPFSPYMTCCR